MGYWDFIRRHIGKNRWAWLKRAEQGRKAYHFTTSDELLSKVVFDKMIQAAV